MAGELPSRSLRAVDEPRAAEPGALFNARIHTLDPDAPTAEAMAWDEQGRIVFLGASDELNASHPELRSVDAQGKTILPGLIDAHGHVMGLGFCENSGRPDCRREPAGGHCDAGGARRNPAKGVWLTGRGWDQTRWEGQAFPERPVWLVRVDGHAGWANSAALALATKDLSGAWQPRGGAVQRDATGQPNGILIDTAMRFIEDAMPAAGAESRVRALQLALAEIARSGLTGVHDMGVSLEDFELYRQLDHAGKLPVRITAFADGDAAMLDWLCANGSHEGDRLQARSVKIYGDGALGSRGAAPLDDYSDDPGNTGLLFKSDGELQELVDRALGCGLQLGIHAIGDAANRQVIDAIASGRASQPDNPGRHRIEHVQIIHADDIPRLAEHDIIASMQPIHATSDMRWAGDRLGDERLEGAYAWASMLERGIHLALGSDFPVEPANPWLGIHAAVTRQRRGLPPGGWQPQEALTLGQALHGFTLAAARAGFAEITVLRTVVGGETVFAGEQ
ncbi:MAG: amidohydrolase [Haliea sp.]|uniref:amidohydrolase n=1 Tax=Haliea sp. TaxID=1932666 RepID=UPI0032EBA19C